MIAAEPNWQTVNRADGAPVLIDMNGKCFSVFLPEAMLTLAFATSPHMRWRPLTLIGMIRHRNWRAAHRIPATIKGTCASLSIAYYGPTRLHRDGPQLWLDLSAADLLSIVVMLRKAMHSATDRQFRNTVDLLTASTGKSGDDALALAVDALNNVEPRHPEHAALIREMMNGYSDTICGLRAEMVDQSSTRPRPFE